MRVAVTGSSGLIGTALRRSLEGDGHEVVAVVRPGSGAGGATITWDLERRTIDTDALRGVDAIVHLAGEPIGGKRWSAEQKRQVLESRTVSTVLLAETLAGFGGDGPQSFVSGSAIGFYGDRGDEVLTEASGPQPGMFLSDVASAWEAAAQPAVDAGVRTAFARTGIVLDAKGGALAKLLPLFKLFVGGKMGSGKQWMAWVAIDDEVAAVRFLLDTPSATGPFNLTAPNPATNAELSKALGEALGRPSFVPVPKFGPKLLLGGEMAEQLLFASQRVVPAAVEAAGFRFAHPELLPALRHILRGPHGYRRPIGRLADVDLSARITAKEEARRVEAAQERLLELRLRLGGQLGDELGPPLCIVFEGWDAAGKGGAIKRLVAPLDPRFVRVTQIAAPTYDEKRHHFLWRFWQQLPGWGGMAVFDRSWYGRVLVERVEGYASVEQWTRAYAEIVDFERTLAAEGMILIKFWMHISHEEQERRFLRRQDDRLKQWKLTDEDWRNRDKRAEYEAAVEDMLERTDHIDAPWVAVEAEQKRYARVRVLEETNRLIEIGMRRWGISPL